MAIASNTYGSAPYGGISWPTFNRDYRDILSIGISGSIAMSISTPVDNCNANFNSYISPKKSNVYDSVIYKSKLNTTSQWPTAILI